MIRYTGTICRPVFFLVSLQTAWYDVSPGSTFPQGTYISPFIRSLYFSDL